MTVELAGVAVEVLAETTELADAATGLMRYAPLSDMAPALSIRLSHSDSIVPFTDSDEIIAEVATKFDTNSIMLCVNGLMAIVDHDGVVVTGTSPNLETAIRRILIPALTYMFALHEIYLIHAGAIVVEGEAILVLGRTGAGKSTAIVAAIASGLPVLGDDVIAVTATEHKIDATGFPRPISIEKELFGAELSIALASSNKVVGDSRNRVELTAGSGSSGSHEVGGLIKVGHSNKPKGQLDPLASVAVAQELLGSSVAVANPATRAAYMSLVGQLAKLPSWQLLHGTDAATRISGTGLLLRQLDPGPVCVKGEDS